MSTLLNSIRFAIITNLYLICLGSIVSPAIGNAASDPSNSRFSTVLAPGQELREGLTSLFPVPNGINGSYGSDGESIYFETRRGPRTPKYLRDGDPATPRFEIDVRFMNQDREPFLIQIGGDTPLDHTWTETVAERKDDAQAKTDFDLAGRAIEALRKLKFTRQFVDERQALLDLAPVLESAQVIEKEEGLPDQALSAPLALEAESYRHRIQIKQKRILFGFAYHSATIGQHINNGVVTTAIITCNHGTCANHSSMALKCLWTSAWPGNRTNRLKNWVSCTTPYNPTSVFFHNSNDDTDLQYQAVRYDFVPSFTGGVCNDSSVNNEPTDCY